MSGLKDLAKNGWHPKGQSGGKESWRGDFKGVNTVAGWVGKSKDPNSNLSNNQHQSAPLSTLKDPASFGPPPKRIPHSVPDSSSRGAQVPTNTRQRQNDLEVEEDERKPTTGYHVTGTTGSNTAQLPKPPVRPPAPGTEKPKLPPRLPPRQNFHSNASIPIPPPTFNESMQERTPAEGYLNQGALDRLGKAGISVPGLNIGGATSPSGLNHRNPPPSDPAPSPVSAASRGPQLNELQSRFSKMAAYPSRAQAPLNASHTEPSSIACHDLGQRREQAPIASSAANALGRTFGVPSLPNNALTTMTPASELGARGLLAKKPPPPPPKKKELAATTGEPPPIPAGSKPKF